MYSQERTVISTSLLPRLLLLASTLSLALVFAPDVLHGQTYTEIHSFDCNSEGCTPEYPQILSQGRDGNLYGTLSGGGNVQQGHNSGTVFKVTPSGTVSTVYTFQCVGSATDGCGSTSGLTLGADGNFYGTTVTGGSFGFGTVFRITPTGTLTTLHSFNATDGEFPNTPPVLGRSGSYYGTTFDGKGYSITSSGTFKMLTSMIPGRSYGPLLLASDGNFYGTTLTGGSSNSGTVFRMSPLGAVKVIYNFNGNNCATGCAPYGPLTQGSDKLLYGTASAGGASTHPGGVVFKINFNGVITVLHQFDSTSTTDGFEPLAGLVAGSDGNFYGSTFQGIGASAYGSLFKISSKGTYSVLAIFNGAAAGWSNATAAQQTAGLIFGLQTYAVPQPPLNISGALYKLSGSLPTFASLVLNAGPVGQSVQVLGQGFTGTTSVTFGSATATSFSVVSDTYLTAVVPGQATTGPVTITRPSGTLTSNRQFLVTPVISSISPTNGPIGTVVTITGTGLLGATQVTFGGVKATNFTVVSSTEITATVPSGAKTGSIAVTTSGGTVSSTMTFTVTQ
jgi:uncharacterized repeat protein (TIGR03803 family)